jgi:hypothetical protein
MTTLVARRFTQPIWACTLVLALLTPKSLTLASDGPFASMKGIWSGPGSIVVNGNKERLRCRATHDVKNGGSTVDLSIRCASDSYKFDLQGGVNYVNGSVTGNWSEIANGTAGSISGTVNDGVIRVSATGAHFSALMSVNTRGSTQSVVITSPGSQISSVTISLSKSGN